MIHTASLRASSYIYIACAQHTITHTYMRETTKFTALNFEVPVPNLLIRGLRVQSSELTFGAADDFLIPNIEIDGQFIDCRLDDA